jgi:coatomer protein complex subunit gamma
VSGIDRFLKQAIVDRDPFIVSSTLCASQQFYKSAPTVVKGFANEVTEALASENKMVQYHALLLLYQIKQNDRLAVTKMVTGLQRNALGPHAMLFQIRIVSKLLREPTPSTPVTDLLKFLESCLHNKSYMVTYEAARAICSLEKLTAPQVQPAIYPLQEFLTSPVCVSFTHSCPSLSPHLIMCLRLLC